MGDGKAGKARLEGRKPAEASGSQNDTSSSRDDPNAWKQDDRSKQELKVQGKRTCDRSPFAGQGETPQKVQHDAQQKGQEGSPNDVPWEVLQHLTPQQQLDFAIQRSFQER